MLRVENLSKRYRKFAALSDLSFTVNSGEIVGLLGPNGAGKTTCMRCISGVVRPSDGRILVGDFDLSQNETEAKRLLAFVPELPNPYELLTVWEHLHFIALAYNTSDDWEGRAAELLARFDLLPKKDELVATLSKGMRQKLTIACAFLHRARVFLFDEPLVGLDPKGARELRGLIYQAAKNDGAAVLVSTHMLDTVQNLCDRTLILRAGQKIAEGTVAELRHRAQAQNDATLEDVFLSLTGDTNDAGV